MIKYCCLGLVMFPALVWSSEATLRAAFVFNFIKFIEWPVASSSPTFNFCVANASQDTRAALLNIDGKSANKRIIQVIHFNSAAISAKLLESCQILYWPNQKPVDLRLPLPSGVVLVADEPSEAEDAVSIALFRKPDGHIAFSVNKDAISQAGVTISSQLLKLAASNRPGGK